MVTETIRVTAGHIAVGVPRGCHHCPIALAVADLHPGPVTVSNDMIIAGITMATLPAAARWFISAFDRDEPVSPFEFTVEWRGGSGA